MNKRKKILTVAALALLVGGLAAGLVLAQESGEEAAASADADSLMGRVAAILGIDEAVLADAFEQARLEGIDAAVADGRLTEEQAEAMKAQIEARAAMRDALESALASGDITQEQLVLLRGRLGAGRSIGQRPGGLRGQASESSDCARGRFGFMMRTPRGGTMRGGCWTDGS